jgi:hypothetical protein
MQGMLMAMLVLGLAAPRPAPAVAPPPPDRVALLASGDAEYKALAIPRSYKTAPEAPMRLLVFRGGLCVRDLGLATEQSSAGNGASGQAIVEERGSMERGYVAADARTAVILRTHYVSRVDVTPGQNSTENDTVSGGTTLTLVDPAHPDGWWQVTLEHARWAKDVLVLPGAHGVVVTTFLPRNGPTDVRILDATGHESTRVPESAAESLRIASSPEGEYVAADVAFRDDPLQPERGVMVFDLANGTHWTYGWRYGSEAEPTSWTLESHGVLAVKLSGGTKRFDATGAKR